MDGTQLIVALIGTGGLGSALVILTQGVVQHWSGAAARQQQRDADALAQRDTAWARMEELEGDLAAARDEIDAAGRNARLTAEYASRLRRQLHEVGVEPLPWPPATART